ncbi:MAG: LON peptidase substrate-binding domain-containing protein [Bacteroidota bacterium]
MARFLPLFPLSMVVFPGEEFRLHIFEPRYKQLINECLADKSSFGIPSVINKHISEVATEVSVLSMDKKYKNGEMDISTIGLKRWQLEEYFPVSEGKLYPGGMLSEMEDDLNSSPDLQSNIFDLLAQLHRTLGITKTLAETAHEIVSFQIGHHIGLSIQQEFELLRIPTEIKRLTYIQQHLQHILPIVTEAERLKSKAKLNGHYKNIAPPEL